MVQAILDRVRSFRHAGRGVVELLRSEANARLHFFATAVAIALGIVLGISPLEWAVLALAIGMVIVTETVNTAIEQLCDRVTRDHDDRIRRIKDLSAAAVLLAAIASVVVGLGIFGPKLFTFMQG